MQEDILAKIQEAINPEEQEQEANAQEEEAKEELKPGEALEEDGEQEANAQEEEDEQAEEIELDTDVLASALGLDEDALTVDEDGQLRISLEIDGKKESVAPAELLKGYRYESHNTRKSQKLAADRREFEDTRDAQLNELKTALGQANQLLELSEQNLLREFDIDWNDLRQNNPAEFAARRQEFTERYGQIQQAKATTGQRQQALTEQQLADLYAREQMALLEKIPAWLDESVAKTEKASLNEYLVDAGFKQEEINSWLDHRAIAVARDAMLYRQQAKNLDIAKKKVRAKPKLVKPGKGKTKAETDSDAEDAAIKRLKKSGSVSDAAELLKQRYRGR